MKAKEISKELSVIVEIEDKRSKLWEILKNEVQSRYKVRNPQCKSAEDAIFLEIGSIINSVKKNGNDWIRGDELGCFKEAQGNYFRGKTLLAADEHTTKSKAFNTLATYALIGSMYIGGDKIREEK